VAGRLPLHASSSGLVLLAHAPVELQDRVLAQPLERFTEHTIASADRLRRTLAEVRIKGYVVCRGHIHPEAAGVAVPLRSGDGAVVAAVAVIVPNDDAAFRAVPALQAAARGIGRTL